MLFRSEASDSSAWLLMGLPGLCYLGGVKETFWTALGLIAGTYLSWLFIAKPLRKCSITFGDSITIPEFLSNRFKDKSHLLSIVSVIFIVLPKPGVPDHILSFSKCKEVKHVTLDNGRVVTADELETATKVATHLATSGRAS